MTNYYLVLFVLTVSHIGLRVSAKCINYNYKVVIDTGLLMHDEAMSFHLLFSPFIFSIIWGELKCKRKGEIK